MEHLIFLVLVAIWLVMVEDQGRGWPAALSCIIVIVAAIMVPFV